MVKQTLTVKETADEMGVNPSAVRRLVSQGHMRRLRGHKGKWLISRFEFERYLKEGLVLS